jgi:hypothetical protein
MLTSALLMQAHAVDALPLGPTLQLGASASFPLKPSAVRDQWNTGFGFSGALLFDTLPLLSIGIEAGYYRHGSDSDAFEETVLAPLPAVQFDGFDYWFVPVMVVAELDLMRWGVTKPFVRGGAGFYRTGSTGFVASGIGSDQVANFLADYSDTALGTLIGFGVRTPLVPGVALSFDATYHFIGTSEDPTHFIPIRVRVEF